VITTLADATDVHPAEFVTVKVFVPAVIPDIVVLVPVPVVVVPPGVLINVHDPVEGNPLKTTLPVDTEQFGCVIVPTVGAVGVAGCAFITALADATEIQPDVLVAVYVYVPVARPDIVLLVPVPVEVVPPGDLVNVHVPDEGKPFKTALPVAKVHVGCVIVPTVGAVGVGGWALITTFVDATEIQPDALVTV
jgi:hypothetical protein